MFCLLLLHVATVVSICVVYVGCCKIVTLSLLGVDGRFHKLLQVGSSKGQSRVVVLLILFCWRYKSLHCLVGMQLCIWLVLPSCCSIFIGIWQVLASSCSTSSMA